MVGEGKKFSPGVPQPKQSEFGGMSKIGEIIGILLQFIDGYANLTFYRNKVSLTT